MSEGQRMSAARPAVDLDGVYRAEFGRAVATLARYTSDIDLAEDAVQEAFAIALRIWDRDGIPANPGAWITTTARRRALDRLRRESARHHKEHEAVLSAAPPAGRGRAELYETTAAARRAEVSGPGATSVIARGRSSRGARVNPW